jgi:hypothetical protein
MAALKYEATATPSARCFREGRATQCHESTIGKNDSMRPPCEQTGGLPEYTALLDGIRRAPINCVWLMTGIFIWCRQKLEDCCLKRHAHAEETAYRHEPS